MSESFLKSLIGNTLSSLKMSMSEHNSPREFVKQELLTKINSDIVKGAKFFITDVKTNVKHEIHTVEDMNGHYIKLVAIDDMGMRINAQVFFKTSQHECNCTAEDDEYVIDPDLQVIVSKFFNDKYVELLEERNVVIRGRLKKAIETVTKKPEVQIGKSYHMDDPDCIFHVLKIDENSPSGVTMIGGVMIDISDDDDDFKTGSVPAHRLREEFKME